MMTGELPRVELHCPRCKKLPRQCHCSVEPFEVSPKSQQPPQKLPLAKKALTGAEYLIAAKLYGAKTVRNWDIDKNVVPERLVNSFNKTTFLQNLFEKEGGCEVLDSSVQPQKGKLSSLKITTEYAYVLYAGQLYFVNKRANECTLLKTVQEQALTQFLEEVNKKKQLVKDEARKLSYTQVQKLLVPLPRPKKIPWIKKILTGIGNVFVGIIAVGCGISISAAFVTLSLLSGGVAGYLIAAMLFGAGTVMNWYIYKNAVPEVLVDLFGKKTFLQGLFEVDGGCEILESSIKPEKGKLSRLKITTEYAYVLYAGQLYFVNKKANECTLLKTVQGQVLAQFLAEMNKKKPLIKDQPRKLSYTDLQKVTAITGHSLLSTGKKVAMVVGVFLAISVGIAQGILNFSGTFTLVKAFSFLAVIAPAFPPIAAVLALVAVVCLAALMLKNIAILVKTENLWAECKKFCKNLFDFSSRCEVRKQATPPTKGNLRELELTTNEAYLRTEDGLYYVDQEKNECTLLASNASCSFRRVFAPPSKDKLHELCLTTKTAYLRVDKQLYYVNTETQECTRLDVLPFVIDQLDLEVKTFGQESRVLTVEELKRIAKITGHPGPLFRPELLTKFDLEMRPSDRGRKLSFKEKAKIEEMVGKGCNLFLISKNDGEKITESYLKKIAQQNDQAPILIKTGDKFVLWGCLNNKWQKTEFSESESKVFKGLPFDNEGKLIKKNDPLLTEAIFEALKKGHTPKVKSKWRTWGERFFSTLLTLIALPLAALGLFMTMNASGVGIKAFLLKSIPQVATTIVDIISRGITLGLALLGRIPFTFRNTVRLLHDFFDGLFNSSSKQTGQKQSLGARLWKWCLNFLCISNAMGNGLISMVGGAGAGKEVGVVIGTAGTWNSYAAGKLNIKAQSASASPRGQKEILKAIVGAPEKEMKKVRPPIVRPKSMVHLEHCELKPALAMPLLHRAVSERNLHAKEQAEKTETLPRPRSHPDLARCESYASLPGLMSMGG